MAWETGTASDRLDLLQKLRDFITGVSSPVSGLNWVTLRDTSLDSPVPTEYEMIFQGNGGGSPEDEIYFGVQTYSGGGPFGWDCRGLTGFDDGSPEGSTIFTDQPGISPAQTYMPLRDTTMTYWFFGDERHVKGAIRTGTAYQPFYMGFIDRYATESEYPYPMLCAASSYNNTREFNNNEFQYATFPHPAGFSGTGLSPVVLRFTDGQWYDFFHYSGVSSETQQDDRGIWPMSPIALGAGTLFPLGNQVGTDNSSMREFWDNTSGGAPVANLYPSPGSPECPPIFPLTLHGVSPSRQMYGEMTGVYWVSGQNVAAEDIFTDTSVSPEVDYIVFQNVHRTDNWHFMAMKMV